MNKIFYGVPVLTEDNEFGYGTCVYIGIDTNPWGWEVMFYDLEDKVVSNEGHLQDYAIREVIKIKI